MNSYLKNFLIVAAIIMLFFLVRPMIGGVSSEQLQQQGLEYYASSTGETADNATVRNFGCHQEILIYKDGEQVMRIGYTFGRLYEI